MSRAARVYVALVLVFVVLASGPGARRSRAFFGLDPASWIVVGQMASVVSNLMAMRDTMIRIRDEALSSYRGLVEPIDDFSGQMRRALGAGASIDLSALGGADPRLFELVDCAALPPGDVGAVPCAPDSFPEPGRAYVDLPGMDPDVAASLEASHEVRAADVQASARGGRSSRPARRGGDGGHRAVPRVRAHAGRRGPPGRDRLPCVPRRGRRPSAGD